MTTTVEQLHERGILSALDLHLARTLGRIGNEARAEVLLAMALLSHHVTAGNVCIDLERPTLLDPSGAPLNPDAFPAPDRWRNLLATSSVVGNGTGSPTPLVLHAGRLYLDRYWRYECTLANDLRARAQRVPPALDVLRLRAALPPARSGTEPDWQRVAAFLALRRGLCVITGGPGTGKTTTVVTIAALTIDQAQGRGERPPHIHLCAPTGKAAARLTAAIRSTKHRLPFAASVRDAIAEEAHTIHRLLGASAAHPGRFRHGPRLPLRTDLLIVDEASMVDLALMARLVAALPAAAGLVLVGDRHQLTSVEAGAVLGDICANHGTPGYSSACAADIRAATDVEVSQRPPQAASPILDCIVTLAHSHRYETESDVGRLAAAIREGAVSTVEALLSAPAHPNIERLDPPPPGSISRTMEAAMVAGYTPYLRATDPTARLAALGRFRILCAHRHGRDGVDAMNREAEHALVTAGLLTTTDTFYEGRPVLVTRNDYRLGLFNGDVGTIVPGSDDEPTRLAFFLAPNGTGRLLSPGRLPPCETAFAISIHKSQGSELDRVLIMLPTRTSPVLSRELLYTAVSRARRQVTICASLDVIREAVATPVHRASGLRDRLRA